MISPELLRRYGCFAAVSDATLKSVAMITEEVSFPAGARLFQEGDPADALSLIVEGEVDLQCQPTSRDLNPVDTLVAGDLLGWSAVIEPYRMKASAVSRTPVQLLRIDAPKLRDLCGQDASLGYRLMLHIVTMLNERLEAARVRMLAIQL